MNLIAFILGLIRGFLRKVPVGRMFRRTFDWRYFFRIMRLRLRSVFRKKFRRPILLMASVLIGVLRTLPWLEEFLGGQERLVFPALLQYGLISIFLFLNRKKPGMIAVLLGTLLNGSVIAANGGRMPVDAWIGQFGLQALERVLAAPHYFLATGDEPLLFLADRIPFWSFGFLMVSLGDLAIMFGIFRLAAYLPRRIGRPRRAAAVY